jgi:hypothetical protein
MIARSCIGGLHRRTALRAVIFDPVLVVEIVVALGRTGLEIHVVPVEIRLSTVEIEGTVPQLHSVVRH